MSAPTETQKDESTWKQIPKSKWIAASVGGGLLLASVVGLTIYGIKATKEIKAAPGGNHVDLATDSSSDGD
jgi:hypothetical protein